MTEVAETRADFTISNPSVVSNGKESIGESGDKVKLTDDEKEYYYKQGNENLYKYLIDINQNNLWQDENGNIAGTKDAGFYGIVPASQLITGDALAKEIELGGNVINDNKNLGWLKFSIDGKTIYKSQKPFRYNISWSHINEKGAVFGDTIIDSEGSKITKKDKDGSPIGGIAPYYKVRLIKGALTNPIENNNNKGANNSEWNRLMLPIHRTARLNHWIYPIYVTIKIPHWDINFTDEDLGVGRNNVYAREQFCQETYIHPQYGSVYRVTRGYDSAPDSRYQHERSMRDATGWSPVLELID